MFKRIYIQQKHSLQHCYLQHSIVDIDVCDVPCLTLTHCSTTRSISCIMLTLDNNNLWMLSLHVLSVLSLQLIMQLTACYEFFGMLSLQCSHVLCLCSCMTCTLCCKLFWMLCLHCMHASCLCCCMLCAQCSKLLWMVHLYPMHVLCLLHCLTCALCDKLFGMPCL